MKHPSGKSHHPSPAKIQILPLEISRKIAAGEVIERPFSVVKELVENSLDALATDIRIELGDGGKNQIRVTDNGHGMSREDALVCFERHSTSKISQESDLERIMTLGFRGEALPSISAVSRVVLKTASPGETNGTLIEREGNDCLRISDVGFPPGTSVEVRNLFFNVPARRKFLRSAKAELHQITTYLAQISLAHHEVGFSLIHEGRSVFSYPGVGTLKERIFQVFGKTVADKLTDIEYEEDALKISGYVSRPPSGRKDKKHQMFYVNGRLVKDKIFQAALSRTYTGFLEKDFYPLAFLFLILPPTEVDVNVHPAKTEVRFVDGSSVFRLITKGLEKALLKGLDIKDVYPKQERAQSESRVEEIFRPPAYQGYGREFQSASELFPEMEKSDESIPRVLGQYLNLYIVVADKEGIRIIDQHNAHERILYEKFVGIERREWPRAFSLFPLLIDLTPSQKLSFEESREQLEEAGYRVEAMGGSTFAIKEYPDLFKEEEARDIFLELLEEMKDDRIENKKNTILATLACKTAIKAGEVLSFEKMTYLVDELSKTKNPSLCPHGRPIQVKIDRTTIEKGLKRI